MSHVIISKLREMRDQKQRHCWNLMSSNQGPRYTKLTLQAKKKRKENGQKEYSDDVLPSSWMQYNQAVCHRYYPFCIYGVLGFFCVQSGHSIIFGLRLEHIYFVKRRVSYKRHIFKKSGGGMKKKIRRVNTPDWL